jgi:hypothetical protein
MTHDELLAKIDIWKFQTKGYDDTYEVHGILNALRAVVELHKPKEEDGKLWCEHEVCYDHIEFLERDNCDCSYPCPTIQAIEKELG